MIKTDLTTYDDEPPARRRRHTSTDLRLARMEARSAPVCPQRSASHPDDMEELVHAALHSVGYYLSGTELHHNSRGTQDMTRH